MANSDLDGPSAQHVGREFVRQYYTLLNEAPLHLHRFYSHNSCFVHGGVEKPGEEQPPVVGQHEIHKKILSLNFRDCHAKIRQVDSQATVGQGVVIQVTGELSNNGEPMRRFMQTFVLAPQSPKKYYVANDVFRYQDEVFNDDEEEEAEEIEPAASEVVENGGQGEPAPLETPVFLDQQSSLSSNGSAHEEEVEMPQSPVMEPSSKLPETTSLEPEISSLDIEEGEEHGFEKSESKPAPEPEPEPEQPPEAAKPCSWAAMASRNTIGAPNVQAFGAPSQVKTQPARPEPKPDPGPSAAGVSSVASGAVPAGAPPQPQRVPRPPKERTYPERDRSSMSRGEEGDGDSMAARRSVGAKYPDSHQLFVGNLPHNITERELKVFFERYGKVMELRINTKSSGGKLPNFGFVVFDAPETVQDILNNRPIKYNGEHRLNVEEKKPRGSDGRPSGGRGAPRGGGPGGLTRGGFGGGRGGVRPGFGRPVDGERRGMGGMGAGSSVPRGGLTQVAPRR